MREILLRDEEFLSKLRHLILISGQGGTESVVGRTDTVLAIRAQRRDMMSRERIRKRKRRKQREGDVR